MSTLTQTRITTPSITAPLFETDAYKLGHRQLDPAHTTSVLSNYLMKDPITDSGTKKSATGRLTVIRNADGELELIEKASPEQGALSLLQPAWANGGFITRQSFADVRAVLGNIAS